jgi:hypothetical protein
MYSIAEHFKSFFQSNDQFDTLIDNEGMPHGFAYKPSRTKDYDFILYTNGCSFVDKKYLDEAVTQILPSALHINRAKGGHGNLEIVDRSIRDLHYLSQTQLPIRAYISFSEVGRNRAEFALNEYFKQILLQEYSQLEQGLADLNVDTYITTSFVSNSFNNNRRIIDDCDVHFDQEVYGAFTTGLVEYIKQRNNLFKFDTQDFVNELDKIHSYLQAMDHSDLISNYHPNRWECYQSIIDFAAEHYNEN